MEATFMNVNQIKRIISHSKSDIAFLIGNGINRYFNGSSSSWNQLLLDLWSKHSHRSKREIPQGISFTEFYDVLEIKNYQINNFSSELQREVKRSIENWAFQKKQNIVLKAIEKHDAPILTTNFDDLIQKSMELSFFKIEDSKFSDFYPWSCYYSKSILSSPTDGFGVWHINGMTKYHRSIKLGLSQYMGNVGHARKMLLNRSGEKDLFNNRQWLGFTTWLNILFNKSLFIFGLSLNENEVFLRWLLIQRAKYFGRYPKTNELCLFLVYEA